MKYYTFDENQGFLDIRKYPLKNLEDNMKEYLKSISFKIRRVRFAPELYGEWMAVYFPNITSIEGNIHTLNGCCTVFHRIFEEKEWDGKYKNFKGDYESFISKIYFKVLKDTSKPIYIRWLGAFRGGEYSFEESLAFEIKGESEVACEKIVSDSYIEARVGVLIDSNSIFRSFKQDCWSKYGEDGILFATRPKNRGSTHTEAWASQNHKVSGIIIKGRFKTLSREVRLGIIKETERSNLPCFYLKGNKLKKFVPFFSEEEKEGKE